MLIDERRKPETVRDSVGGLFLVCVDVSFFFLVSDTFLAMYQKLSELLLKCVIITII